MDKFLKIALMLTAIDNMSNVVNSAVNKSLTDMQRLKQFATEGFANGAAMIAAGKAGFAALKPTTEAFGDMQEAGLRLQNSMMRDGGVLDYKIYDKMYKYAQKLSDGYTGSTEDYLNMMRVLKNNRVTEADILGGIGEATAKFGHLFKMQPAAIGEFAAHMRNDMGVAVKDMGAVMDLAQRAQGVGVGKTGEETVYEMNQFFSKVGLGLVNLKSQGLASAKAMATLGSIFMAKGLSGENVGTNFRRILDGLRDPGKIDRANEVAAKYHKTLSFYDKKGNFAGIENFIAQLDKLKNLDTEAISAILKPFAGRQGLSTDFLEMLAHNGVDEYNKMGKQMFNQATLTQKENNLSKGLNQNIAIFKSSWRNTLAEVGATMAPVLTKLFVLLNKFAIGLRNFVANHPGLTKMAVAIVAIGSSVLIAAGAIKIFTTSLKIIDAIMGITKALKWLRIAYVLVSPGIWSAITATWAWTAALLANPITWIVLAVVALGVAVYELIKHWDVVGPWFHRMWDKVKSAFTTAIKWLWKYIVPIFNPGVLIIQHWDKISTWFRGLWERVKAVFVKFIGWMIHLNIMFFNAGKNIVTSIAKGIENYAHLAIDKVKAMVQKIRNFLPFSPAKEGPLRDIHRIRLIETIADSIRPNALIEKMRLVTEAVFMYKPQQAMQPMYANTAPAQQQGATIHLTYAPVYNAPQGAGADDRAQLMDFFEKNKRQLMDMLSREYGNTRLHY